VSTVLRYFSTWREVSFLLLHPQLWGRKPLEIEDLQLDPFQQFTLWYQRAQKSLSGEFSNWMCLSTVDNEGFPDGRIVLLKEFSSLGFVFYTNKTSQKGAQLQAHPFAALTFYWEALQWQVRIRGGVSEVAPEQADRYFASRPRESQIGAWASDQSAMLTQRKELLQRTDELRNKFAGNVIERPPFWTGFQLTPFSFEFWELRRSRLHDRFRYVRDMDKWRISRLNP
jgi:pyridoxamine 5'-phosphate oxidase